eukprot:4992299-Ditylum_brightwellii.AAC.1
MGNNDDINPYDTGLYYIFDKDSYPSDNNSSNKDNFVFESDTSGLIFNYPEIEYMVRKLVLQGYNADNIETYLAILVEASSAEL